MPLIFRKRIVPFTSPWMTFSKISGVGGNFISDDAVLDVLLVRQPQVLLGRHVAEHGGAEPADHRRADGRGDVVVTGRDVGGQRAERIEGRDRKSTRLNSSH